MSGEVGSLQSVNLLESSLRTLPKNFWIIHNSAVKAEMSVYYKEKPVALAADLESFT